MPPETPVDGAAREKIAREAANPCPWEKRVLPERPFIAEPGKPDRALLNSKRLTTLSLQTKVRPLEKRRKASKPVRQMVERGRLKRHMPEFAARAWLLAVEMEMS
jgi:hypothetical protein